MSLETLALIQRLSLENNYSEQIGLKGLVIFFNMLLMFSKGSKFTNI